MRWTVCESAALLALNFQPFAFVPYRATAPALGVLAPGIGPMLHDGLLVQVGYALAAVTACLLTALPKPRDRLGPCGGSRNRNLPSGLSAQPATLAESELTARLAVTLLLLFGPAAFWALVVYLELLLP